MATVTISRELGSYGARVAEGVAAALGWTLVDKGRLDRVFRQYGLSLFSDLYDKKPTIWDFFNADAKTTLEMYHKVVQAFAKAGNVVLLGRGGFAVLGHRDDTVDVRVNAPLETRIERVVARRKGRTPEDAAARIAAQDEVRERFVKQFYGRTWNDPENFDLVIDTGTTSVEDAVAQVVAAVKAIPADAHETQELPVDPVLAKTIDEVLGRA
ncbi:MAG: cytidylate kinase-like family protein [Micropruina sp.]|nr:MAG: cytidylate kinase-like family protein [Micropruina sp.]